MMAFFIQDGRQVVLDRPPSTRLEHLEGMARVRRRPEGDDGFERRAAGQAAGDLGDEHDDVVGQREALARPGL